MNKEMPSTRRIGLALLIIGTIETGLFVLSMIIGKKGLFPVMLSLIGIVAGIGFIVGNARMNQFLSILLTVLLGFLSAGVVAFFFKKPLGLLLVMIRLRTLSTVAPFFSLLVDAGLTYWICLQLRSANTGGKTSWWWLLMGAFMILFLTFGVSFVLPNNPSIQSALTKARNLYGSEYEYDFTGFKSEKGQKGRPQVIVTAYNKTTIQELIITDY